MIKKKIKDMTIKEVKKICDKYYCCNECPLEIHSEHYCMKNIIIYIKEFLDKDAEVEE